MTKIDLVCLGNPLLDLQARVDPAFLKEFDLKANDAILIEEKHLPIYDRVLKTEGVVLVAGGAAQNTARGAAYILPENTVAYFGSVGKDIYSEKLLEANTAAHVVTRYQYQENIQTGKCAALLTNNDRSLATDLAAANHFTADHLRRPENWKLIEEAKVFYVGGFHFTVCVEAIKTLGSYASRNDKLFGVNMSAPFIPTVFKEQLDSTAEYWDFIISNETEAAAYASSHGLNEDAEAVAKSIALLPKANPKRPRWVIITQGLEDTVVAIGNLEKNTVDVKRFPVVPLDQNKIVDTNGAGDAFAGGFLAAQVEGKSLDDSIKEGQWLANLSIQEVGPSYPKVKLTYN